MRYDITTEYGPSRSRDLFQFISLLNLLCSESLFGTYTISVASDSKEWTAPLRTALPRVLFPDQRERRQYLPASPNGPPLPTGTI